jgi:hypothetical protein
MIGCISTKIKSSPPPTNIRYLLPPNILKSIFGLEYYTLCQLLYLICDNPNIVVVYNGQLPMPIYFNNPNRLVLYVDVKGIITHATYG